MLTVQDKAVTATWNTRIKVVHKVAQESYMKDPEKSRADSAARSRESHKKDLEKSRNDSAAWSCESYLKDPEKSRAQNCESYMKDPEKSHADSAAQSH